MAEESKIAQYKKDYSGLSDAELIHQTYAWVPHSAQHIAAQQLLAQRRAIKEEERHNQIEERLDALKVPHWTVQPNFWITTVSAIAAIFAAYFAWLSVRPESSKPPAPAASPAPPAVQKDKTTEPNQPAQHNAGSPPSSGDSPASATPSEPAPRG